MRHNRPRSRRRSADPDRYAREYIPYRSRPDVSAIIAHPLKTVYLNASAAPWADRILTITSPDDPILMMLVRAPRGPVKEAIA